MSSTVRIRLEPLGASIEAPRGSSLQDILSPYGVEFPCGGQAECKGCRIRVLAGTIPSTSGQEEILSQAELDAGWRLACRCTADSDLTLALAQWEAVILADDAAFSFTPRPGLGIAVDVGTTTLAAQILDLRTANVLAVRTALNLQAKHGADIMTRIGFAVAGRGRATLTDVIRDQIGAMVRELIRESGSDPAAVTDIVLVGNTAMHHLFCGIDCTPLSRTPFEPHENGLKVFAPPDLGWDLGMTARVRFLPCLGGFVGSDILAGMLATDIHQSRSPACLIDLGTNGEIVVSTPGKLLCCSTAAGPAFEGARIAMGMRAVTGAITEVHPDGAALRCTTLGGVAPRGICGSGLVDAAAAMLDNGRLLRSGRFAGGEKSAMIADPVSITQTDIRELQLAKGAIAAGITLALRESGVRMEDIGAVYLAGAFGNYVRRSSARRIGLIEFPEAIVHPSGNTALRGAKRALFGRDEESEALASRVIHLALNELRDFQDLYVSKMGFPESGT